MFVGEVIGTLWSSRKVADLAGNRFLVIQPLDQDGVASEKVMPVVAADPVGAREGDRVMVAYGRAARNALGGNHDVPIEAAVIGIVDEGSIGGKVLAGGNPAEGPA